jgi:hypothetical protein
MTSVWGEQSPLAYFTITAKSGSLPSPVAPTSHAVVQGRALRGRRVLSDAGIISGIATGNTRQTALSISPAQQRYMRLARHSQCRAACTAGLAHGFPSACRLRDGCRARRGRRSKLENTRCIKRSQQQGCVPVAVRPTNAACLHFNSDAELFQEHTSRYTDHPKSAAACN